MIALNCLFEIGPTGRESLNTLKSMGIGATIAGLAAAGMNKAEMFGGNFNIPASMAMTAALTGAVNISSILSAKKRSKQEQAMTEKT